MNNFDRIQGGETGKSPQRALTVETTMKSVKIIVAHWVARLFGLQSVALIWRDRCGYTPSNRAFCKTKIRSNATYHSFSTAC